MEEAHFRPPRPARTARLLGALAGAALLVAVVGWMTVGVGVALVGALAAAALAVVAVLLGRVELVLRPSGIEIVDITGRRQQAWVGTDRLLVDFARPRPVLEIHAPGPERPYRSTLVLAGLQAEEHAQARRTLHDLLDRWIGSNVQLVVRQPGDDPAA